MRELDGIRILGPADGDFDRSPRSRWREVISASDTGDRWRLGEVTAVPDEGVATHLHPREPEALIILEGAVELHGAQGVAQLHPGDIVFIPPRYRTRPADSQWWPLAGHLAHPRTNPGQALRRVRDRLGPMPDSLVRGYASIRRPPVFQTDTRPSLIPL